MKKRASITLTFSADLDMVKGWGDKATDWVDLIKQRLLTSDTYSPEIDVHEIIEAPYSYEEGKGYVRPKVFTMADRALVSEDLVSMLDRIHQIMDTEKEARYLIPMFDEIGCLIAKARGEYEGGGTAMTKVWIVEGEHHAVPGMVVKVCASKPLADLEAAALVKIILHDLGGGTDVTADNWEEQLEAAKVEYIDHYNDEPRVEISEHDVIGDPL